MKLLLFSIMLTISTSRQQDSTETLNETLDRLIKQTTKAGYGETNDNNLHSNKTNSKIFFLQPRGSQTQSEKDSDAKVPNAQMDDGKQVKIADILHALGLKNPKLEENDEKSKKFKEVTYTVEKNKEPRTTNTDTTEIHKVLELLSSRSGASAVAEDSSADAIITSSGSKTEMNMLHRYPEIIVDKIVYPGDKPKAEKFTENDEIDIKQVNQAAEKQNSIKLAQELKSLLEELQKIKTESDNDNNKQRSSQYTMPQITDLHEEAIPKPCSTCVLLNKITHQNSERSGRTGLDASLQFKTWEDQHAGHNALMIISRAEKLKRIQFITRLINKMMSRFVYRPLYGYSYH